MTEGQPQQKSEGRKALDYAENQLGVHNVYTQLLETRNKLDDTLTALSDARDKRRDLEEALETVAIEVATEERAKHPDMSQAQMDKHVKGALWNNAEAKKLRAELNDVRSTIDGLEMDERMHEHDIKIALARMNELGGYLQYLAVAKLSNLRGGGNAGPVIPGW